MIHKKKKNSSKVNLTISTIVHALLVGGLVFFAAKEGLLGKKLKQLTVTMVPKEKKPEPPKEKPPEPKAEPPKPAESPKTTPQAPKVEQAATPPPANDSPVAAPAAAIVSDFTFSDGAKANQTISDPNGIYKSIVEHAMKAHWNRDESIDDSQFVADVEVEVDSKGRITDTRWVSLSGNAKWDNAVKSAVAQTKSLSKGPPKGFPSRFVVRFDVESLKSETLQLSSSN
jgi:outer membrane biosynthesis protein TonB